MAPASAVETGVRPSMASMTKLISLPSMRGGVTRCSSVMMDDRDVAVAEAEHRQQDDADPDRADEGERADHQPEPAEEGERPGRRTGARRAGRRDPAATMPPRLPSP